MSRNASVELWLLAKQGAERVPEAEPCLPIAAPHCDGGVVVVAVTTIADGTRFESFDACILRR